MNAAEQRPAKADHARVPLVLMNIMLTELYDGPMAGKATLLMQYNDEHRLIGLRLVGPRGVVVQKIVSLEVLAYAYRPERLFISYIRDMAGQMTLRLIDLRKNLDDRMSGSTSTQYTDKKGA